MITNLTVRVLGNNAVFVQYHEDGKAKDAAFMDWKAFIVWLEGKVGSKPDNIVG
jgi:hypothetical protein